MTGASRSLSLRSSRAARARGRRRATATTNRAAAIVMAGNTAIATFVLRKESPQMTETATA